jgi:hypothetical protein
MTENNYLGMKKPRPNGIDTEFQARIKVEPTVQSWTSREDYLDFKLASRRNRKQRLKSGTILLAPGRVPAPLNAAGQPLRPFVSLR